MSGPTLRVPRGLVGPRLDLSYTRAPHMAGHVCCCRGSGACRALHAWNRLDLLTGQNGVGASLHLEGRGKEPLVAGLWRGLPALPVALSPPFPPQPQKQCNSPHIKSKHLAASAMPKINQELIGGTCTHNRSWMGKEGAVHSAEAKACYLGSLSSLVY